MVTYSKTSEIHCAVIGYSNAFDMGREHFRLMRRAGMQPTSAVDADPARLAAALADHPDIETYSSAAEMLRSSSTNLVVIITPHNTHARLAMQCLRAGRHVVCKKPMAVTTAACDRMIAEARRKKYMLSAFHNRHWDGGILRALRTIRRGTISDVQRVQIQFGQRQEPQSWWQDSRSISGGIVYDWGVHLYGVRPADR